MRQSFRWIAAGVIVTVLALSAPAVIKVAYLLSTPLSCDDQIAENARNARGDVASEILRICFGLGAFVDYSVTLQINGTNAHTTLAQFTPSPDSRDPVAFRWIDDDTLFIDLGKVRSVWSRDDKIGSIRITYQFTQVER